MPGVYPCGGPVETVLDIYQLFAPSLDFLSPDNYDPNYTLTCENYSHRDRPLFIPEQRRNEWGALRSWLAVGTYNALATSPFGIDTDPNSAYKHHYGLLKKVEAIVLDARSKGCEMCGVSFDRFDPGSPDPSPAWTRRLGEWDILIERSFTFGHPKPGFGLIIQTAPDEFLLIGEGFEVGLTSAKPSAVYSGILSFDEKEVVDVETGRMETVRMLNGDESRGGDNAVMPSNSPDYGDFPIAITIPANTRIAEIRAYCIEE